MFLMQRACRRPVPASGKAARFLRAFSSSNVDDEAAAAAAAAFFQKGPRWSLRSLGGRGCGGQDDAGSVVDLDRMADLAHLKIVEAARPGLEKDLGEILSMAALVQDATVERDSDNIRREGYDAGEAHGAPTPLRKDKVISEDRSKELLANAKRTEEGYFVVPNVQDMPS